MLFFCYVIMALLCRNTGFVMKYWVCYDQHGCSVCLFWNTGFEIHCNGVCSVCLFWSTVWNIVLKCFFIMVYAQFFVLLYCNTAFNWPLFIEQTTFVKLKLGWFHQPVTTTIQTKTRLVPSKFIPSTKQKKWWLLGMTLPPKSGMTLTYPLWP